MKSGYGPVEQVMTCEIKNPITSRVASQPKPEVKDLLFFSLWKRKRKQQGSNPFMLMVFVQIKSCHLMFLSWEPLNFLLRSIKAMISSWYMFCFDYLCYACAKSTLTMCHSNILFRNWTLTTNMLICTDPKLINIQMG